MSWVISGSCGLAHTSRATRSQAIPLTTALPPPPLPVSARQWRTEQVPSSNLPKCAAHLSGAVAPILSVLPAAGAEQRHDGAAVSATAPRGVLVMDIPPPGAPCGSWQVSQSASQRPCDVAVALPWMACIHAKRCRPSVPAGLRRVDARDPHGRGSDDVEPPAAALRGAGHTSVTPRLGRARHPRRPPRDARHVVPILSRPGETTGLRHVSPLLLLVALSRRRAAGQEQGGAQEHAGAVRRNRRVAATSPAAAAAAACGCAQRVRAVTARANVWYRATLLMCQRSAMNHAASTYAMQRDGMNHDDASISGLMRERDPRRETNLAFDKRVRSSWHHVRIRRRSVSNLETN